MAKLSRKDFRELAKLFNESRPWWCGDTRDQWIKDTATLADWLQSTNPLFDKAKFLEACDKGL